MKISELIENLATKLNDFNEKLFWKMMIGKPMKPREEKEENETENKPQE